MPARDHSHQRDAVLALLAKARSLTPRSRPADLPRDRFPDVPDWHAHEYTIWTLGEEARQILASAPSLRGNHEIYGEIAQLITTRSAGRGRQPWVMLFGYAACAPFAPVLAELLDDPDVAGHAVGALTRTRVPDHVDQVVPLLDDNAAWIRRAARRYVDRFDGQPRGAAPKASET